MLDKTVHNKILFSLETKTDIEISRSRFIRINSILRFAKAPLLKHSALFQYQGYHNYIRNEEIEKYFTVPIEL